MLTAVPVRRMKADRAPSPEFARPDPSQASSSTDDAEKAEVDVAVRPVAEHLIDGEEERFEWREVVRGALGYDSFVNRLLTR